MAICRGKRMKKKEYLAVFIFLSILGASLYGCSQNANIAEGPGVSQPVLTATSESIETATALIPEPSQIAKTTGFRMVSDGEFIYYSQYEEPGLRKISADLSSEVLLADEDCIYLNLVGDMLYYVVPGSGIWQIKTDGSERKQLEMVEDASWLDYDNGMLYFLQNGNIYRFDLEAVDTTMEELESEYGAAAVSEAGTFFRSEKINDEYCNDLTVSDGLIFYTASQGEENFLYRIDSVGNEPTVVASGVNSNIYIDNGRLYYLEEGEISEDFDVNTRICSIDLSGNDRKIYFEEINAAGYFSVSDDYLYFTRYHTGGEDNFEGSYLYRMNIASGDIEALYDKYDISDMLEVAGDYIWFNHFSYDTTITSDYWGKTDGSKVALIADLRPETARSEYLDPYVEPYGPGESYLALSTDTLSACYKLIRMDDTVEFVQFLDPESEITISFPSGRYILKIAEGSEWLGDDQAFGKSGLYSTTDVYQFDEGYTYEIVGGTTGDFNTDSIDGFLD